MHATGVPTVPVVGQLMLATRARGDTVTVAVAEAVFALLSVAVTEIVKVPLALYVVLKLAVLPVEGEPPVAVHAKV